MPDPAPDAGNPTRFHAIGSSASMSRAAHVPRHRAGARHAVTGLLVACVGLGTLAGCGSSTASTSASASMTDAVTPSPSGAATGAGGSAVPSSSGTPGGSATSTVSTPGMTSTPSATMSASATPRPSATHGPARLLPGELAPDKVQHSTPVRPPGVTFYNFRFPRRLGSLPRYSYTPSDVSPYAWYVNATKRSDFVDVETDSGIDPTDMAGFYLSTMTDASSYRGGTIMCGYDDHKNPTCVVRLQKLQFLQVSGSTSANRLAKYTAVLLDAQG